VRQPISITAHISLLFALWAATVLLLGGIGLEYALKNRFLKEDIVELRGKMEMVRTILSGAGRSANRATVPLGLKVIASGHPGIIIMVKDRTGVLFSSGNVAVANQLLREREPAGGAPSIQRYGAQVYRFVSSRIERGRSDLGPAQAVIALDITDDQNFIKDFRRYLWGGMALVSLTLVWLGWTAVRHGLRPLRQVSALVGAISSKQLDKPLDDRGVPAELRELVAAFNAMLTRLHDSFRSLSEFSSDIAHELRTPIHNLLLQTQVTLAGDESLTAYRTVLQSNEEEYQRLSRMITDMLFLAKADNKLLSLKKERVNLPVEVAGLFEFYDAMASERGITLRQSGEALVSADRLMIQRALSNLLSNALRYTPPGGEINVESGIDGAWARLAVTNPGSEIPVEQQERIFERLYRIDPSRREGHTDNVGLGLAITRSIIEMHGGKISVSSNDGRVIFTMTLPCA
jgi:two-component system, OmpR family, heavy metal sensor histidine kinase CusS